MKLGDVDEKSPFIAGYRWVWLVRKSAAGASKTGLVDDFHIQVAAYSSL